MAEPKTPDRSPVSSDAPLDTVVSNLINRAHLSGRGFVLNMFDRQRAARPGLELPPPASTGPAPAPAPAIKEIPASVVGAAAGTVHGVLVGTAGQLPGPLPADHGGECISIAVHEQLPVDADWEPRTSYRNHTLGDTPGFIQFARRYGDGQASLVMYGDDKVTLTLDEEVERGERETVSMPFVYSEDWNDWHGILETATYEHRKLLEVITAHAHNLDDIKMLESMRAVKTSAELRFDSDIRETEQQVGLTFKVSGGDAILNFPKSFNLRLPVLDVDISDQTVWPVVEVKVNILMPADPKDKLRFMLVCPSWAQVRRGRINRELDTVRAALTGWTIVRGAHAQWGRKCGYPKLR